MLVFFGREDAGRGCELCSRNFSPNGAGGNFHLGVVADALRLSHVAAGHDVKLVAVFSEPYGRGDASTRLAERGQRNIFLSCDWGRDWASHGEHCSGITLGNCQSTQPSWRPSGWRGWFASGSADCSYPVICVTSLNMRKWMRERLQRRKKKSDEQVSQPAPPPLQPAYFDAEEPSEAEPESRSEAVEGAEKEVEAQPIAAESGPVEREQAKPRAVSGAAQRSVRGRRRRGGRGRGGRGREQAVAEAFTPKGIPGAPGVEPDSAEPESAEAEPAIAEPAEVAEGEAQPVSAAPHAPAVPAVVPSAPSRPPKGIVVLAIGLPGSGKSSWFKRHSVVPLSSDMVRSLLFDDVREQRFQDLVFSNLRSMLKARLIAKRPMNYVDATNLTPQERQHWIKLAKDYNYEVHAVFFDVPLEVCVERHQRRDRVVPEDVMRRMAAKLKPPAFQEGFAKITVVRVKKKDAEPAEA